MKRISPAAILSTTLLAAASALAQAPAAVPQTTTAPAAATAPASDVSTLNGELVPVGEANRFRYSHPRWNVSSNPLGWIIGSYGASVSYAPLSQVAVRGDVSYYRNEGDRGFELGLGAPIYFRKMYSGFFLEPGLTFKVLSNDDSGTRERTTVVGPQVMLGWHWFWDSGLNVAAALGAGRNWNSSSSGTFDDYNEIFPAYYLRFGYAF
jgi:hypothetical protein